MQKKLTGCLFLNRAYIKWQHAMVLDLRNRFGIDKWCGLSYGRGAYGYVKNQKDITYEPLLVNDFLGVEADKEIVDEEYLDRKEKEYGHPYLWQEFINDRHISIDWPRQFYPTLNPNRNLYQIKQQFQIRIRKIEEMLDQAKPDFVLFVDAGAMAVNLLYYIAKKKSIPTLVLWTNRPGEVTAGVSDNLFGTFNIVDKIFKEIREGRPSPKREEAVKWIENFRKKPARPFWLLPADFWNKFGQSPWRKLVLFAKNFVRKCIDSFNDPSFPRIYGYSPLDFVKHNFLLWKNAHSGFKFDEPDYKESYVFFPLHQEPELNLLMYAQYFADQAWVAKTIAQSIPLNYKLYVKDHPLMPGYRNPKFYKEIKKFPNIKVIDPKVDSIELIKNAKLITTITGTVGWEATLLKKPVITFGSIYYNSLSFIKKCKIISELPNMVKDMLENFKYNEEELIDFASAMLEDSFKIDFTKLVSEQDIEKIKQNPDLTAISDAVMKYMHNHTK